MLGGDYASLLEQTFADKVQASRLIPAKLWAYDSEHMKDILTAATHTAVLAEIPCAMSD